MAQSLAREFGPKGVHIAHAVIDGVIDIPRTKEWDLGEGGKIDPDAVSFLCYVLDVWVGVAVLTLGMIAIDCGRVLAFAYAA